MRRRCRAGRPGARMEDVNATNRAELAAFLRARRARMSPRQAGLPDYVRIKGIAVRRKLPTYKL